jgi:hypothetical protein
MMLHHLLFPQLADRRWKLINLNAEAEKAFPGIHNPLIDPSQCNNWVNSLHKEQQVDYSYGGYMENRDWLWRDHYMPQGQHIHVGVDYNVPCGILVHLPAPARLLMVEEDPDKNGGWGTRAIFEMQDQSTSGIVFVTFAHLWIAYGDVGRSYQKGYQLGEVGNMQTNGKWFPHLHVQTQRKYDPAADGYQRYSRELQTEYPNPEVVLCRSPLAS